MATRPKIRFTDDDDADRLLTESPLALLIGMLLDQQVPMEWAFAAPEQLRQRLGGTLDAAAIAAMDPDEFRQIFSERPALHRFPGSMGGRVHALCVDLVESYDGDAEKVWSGVASGDELLSRLKALPGFGEQKARIFVAILAKRVGIKPAGWEKAAGPYAAAGYYSVADIDGPDALARVREHKRAVKAEAKAAKAAG
jgi:uncharacterized HhH-GPD family protein